MKQLLTLIMLCMTLVGQAQYFDHLYSPFKMGSGLVTTRISDGHLIAGVEHVNSAQDEIALYYTLPDGSLTTGRVRSRYHITWNSHEANALCASAIELSDSTGFVVMGTFVTDDMDQLYFIYYLRVAVDGSILQQKVYPVTTNTPPNLAALVQSPNDADIIYATGNISPNELFVLKLDMGISGGLVWGKSMVTSNTAWPPDQHPDPNTLSPLTATDIVFSPYYNGLGHNELIIVGGIYDNTNGSVQSWNGLWLEMDELLGTGIVHTVYDWNPGQDVRDEIITGIRTCNRGFITSGIAQNTTTRDNYWITEFAAQNTPAIQWSSYYKSPHDSGNRPTQLYDIIERNSSEYYAIGKDVGNSQLLTLIKVDGGGGVLTGREYDRGQIEDLRPVNIDLNVGTSYDGVSLYSYGYSNVTNDIDMSITKAYLNGVIPCESDPYEPDSFGMVLVTYNDPGDFISLDDDNSGIDGPRDIDYTPHCFGLEAEGGSNELIGSTGLNKSPVFRKSSEFVYPNPCLQTHELNVMNNTPVNTWVTVTIYDFMGRLVYSETYTSPGPATVKTLSLNTAELSKGIYLVNIASGSQKATKQLIIE